MYLTAFWVCVCVCVCVRACMRAYRIVSEWLFETDSSTLEHRDGQEILVGGCHVNIFVTKRHSTTSLLYFLNQPRRVQYLGHYIGQPKQVGL